MKRLLTYLPLLCLISCAQYSDIKTVVQIQEKNVSSELVEQTRQQLIQRLQNKGFQDVRVKQGKSPIQLVISTKIEVENDGSHKQYHNLLRKGKLGMWHTYRYTESKIVKVLAQVPEMSSLEFNNGEYTPVVFANLAHEDSLLVAKQRLEKYFADFKNLQFLWSNKPNVHSGAYGLYAIDTRGKTIAPITNEEIIVARYDLDPRRDIYTVTMEMNQDGAVTFGRMTRQTIMREIAIVMDHRVISAPTVQSEVKDGRVEITGNFTADEAQQLSDVIQI